MSEQPWSLTTTEFDYIWQTLNLGDYPFPLQVPSFGRTDRDRVSIALRVRDSLRDRGLFHVSAPDPDLERALRVVASAEQWLDSVWLAGENLESPVRVITARTDGRTVLLRQEPGPDPHAGGTLTLKEIAPQRLVEAALDELPVGTPGAWRPEPMAADALAGAVVEETSPWEPKDRAPHLRELMSGTHRAGGQIGINLRESGRRRRALAARWFDRADDGRYLAISTAGADGRPWITVAPADRTAMRTRITQTMGELTAL
ncbi:ESX secretion-associated protein EspG [Actinokineospora sp.]|uniref:ESX secretion-associated protein EspG n=1 Tax=Actinokineospora sp. TaxID=1872133 RepID=UPI003D6AB1F0